MHVIRAAEARTFELPGVLFTSLAAPALGSAETCVWQLTVEPGVESDPHTLDHDEVFVVIDGNVRLTPGGPSLGPGDAGVVPAGEAIALTNLGGAAARILVAIRAGFTATMSDGTPFGTPPWAA
jgi:quercetin dioxygenase-like cupin family protein